MQRFLKILFSLSLYIASAYAQIHEIRNIHEIMDNIDESTLVLFDIDDTLIHTEMTLGSHKWEDFLKMNMKGNHSANLVPMMWFTMRNIPFIALEDNLPELIAVMQNQKNACVLALTARHPISVSPEFPEINLTIKQLDEAGIFLGTNPYAEIFLGESSLDQGVLFCSGKAKGPFLKGVLDRAGHEPKKIVFVDDKFYHVQSVDQSMREAGIQCECFWYRRIEEKRADFDPLIAIIQLEKYLKDGILLSDIEAALLKGEYEGIIPESYFLELMEEYDPLATLQIAM